MSGYLADRSGISLLEVLIAMAIAAIVVTSLTSVYSVQSKSFNVQQQVTEMQQNARVAADVMAREIRMAGYSTSYCTPPQTGIASADTSSIGIKYSVGSNVNLMVFQLYSGNKVGRMLNGVRQQLAENVQSLEFKYRDGSGLEMSPPIANLSNIRQVQFSVTARTANSDPEYAPNNGYRTYLLTSTIVLRSLQ